MGAATRVVSLTWAGTVPRATLGFVDPASWTVLGVGVAILVAISAAFRALREDLGRRPDAQGERIDGQGHWERR